MSKYPSEAEKRRQHNLRVAARCKEKADAIDSPKLRKLVAKLGAGGAARKLKLPCNVVARIVERMRADLVLPDKSWRYVNDTVYPVCVSNKGEVLSGKTGVWVRLRGGKSHGYLSVAISKIGWRGSVRIHQLVISAFGPPRPTPYHVCCHKNDVKTDNRACNLYWGTARDNTLDCVKNGHNRHRLSARLVKAIYRSCGWPAEIARKFNVGYNTVANIRKGLAYTPITCKLPRCSNDPAPTNVRKKGRSYLFSDHQVASIRRRALAGETYGDIAKDVGSDRVSVRKIATGKLYKWVPGALMPTRRLSEVIRNLPTPLTTNPVEHGRLYDPDHKPPQEAL